MTPGPNVRRVRLLTGCALALFATTAMADETDGIPESLYALYDQDTAVGRSNNWRFTLGAGVVDMPAYPGADSRRTEAIPLIGASYDRWFIGANPDAASLVSLGGYLVRDEQWRVGLAVTYDFVEPREESESARLEGLGDVDRTTHAELFAIYTIGWASLRGSILSDIGGNQRGAVVTFDAMGRFQVAPQWVITAGPGLSWASDQYNRAFFGVTEEQSINSGFPVYRPGSGLYNVGFSTGASFRPSQNWNIAANVAAEWLQGDADDSPIVEKSNQMTYTLMVSYLF